MTKRYFLHAIFFTFCLALSFNLYADDESEPKIGTVDGRQLYCIFDKAPDIFVKVEVPANYQKTVEKYVVEWYEVGSSNIQSLEIKDELNPAPFRIPFDLTDLLEDCLPDKRFDVTLYTYIKDAIEPVNNGFKITFRKAPETRFIYDTTAVCSKTPATLNGLISCPSSSITTYEWLIEGKTLTGGIIQYEFPAPGIYPVRLITENDCGRDTLIQDIEVVNHPFDDVAVSAALNDGVNDFCLGDDDLHEVLVDASASKNYTSFTWRVSGNAANYKIIDTDHAGKKRFQFTAAGRYDIYLQIAMRCNYIYMDTFRVQILDVPELELMQVNTACGSYNFVPSASNPAGTVYFVNDILVQSFPHSIGIGEHKVKAQFNDICGLVKEEKSIWVMDPDEVMNPLTPQQFTICLQDGKITIPRTHLYSSIASAPGISMNTNNEYEFTPAKTGTFLFTEQLGEGACLFQTTITVHVSDVENDLADLEYCATGSSIYPIPENLKKGILEIDNCSNCIQADHFNFSGTTDRQFSIRYTVENSDGCKIAKQAILKIVEPVAEFELTGLPCLENVEVVYNNQLASTFSWSINQSDKKSAFNNLRDQLKDGQNTVTLYASIGRCTDTLTKTFNIIEGPSGKSAFNLSQPACSPYLLTPGIQHPNSTQYSYAWKLNYNGVTENFYSYQFPNNYYLNAGIGESKPATMIYTVENVCGIDSQVVSFHVFNKPVAEIGISPSKEACEKLQATLTNRSYGTIDQVLWEFDKKTLSSKDHYFEHIFIAVDTTTYFPIKLTVSNQCGEDTAYDTIKIFIPNMNAFYSADNFEICPGEPVAFKDASVPRPNQWKWDFGDGTTSTEPNPVHYFDGQKESYQVTLFVSTGCGWDTLTQTIQIKSHPFVDFTFPVNVCSREAKASITAHSIKSGQNYTWIIGDNAPVSDVLNPVLYFEKGGSHNITLSIRELFTQCISELTKSIEVREKPVADFVSDSTHCLDASMTVSNTSVNANHFSWFLNDVLITSAFSPNVDFSSTGYQELKLIAYNEDYCSDTTSKRFLIKRCGYYIPNAFTPNNDGVDDYFTIYGADELAKIKSLRIFNRWGQLVFEKQNFLPNINHEGWDGTYQRKNDQHTLGPQVFIYQARLLYQDGEEELVSGDITLIK